MRLMSCLALYCAPCSPQQLRHWRPRPATPTTPTTAARHRHRSRWPGPRMRTELTATLISNKDSYALDPAQSGKEFRARRLDAIKNGKPPATPAG